MNIIGKNTIETMMIPIQAMMLSQNPADTISLMDTFPVPNTIAFGGVPTGNMNAQFAAIAAGAIRIIGCTSNVIASAPSKGKINVAVAVFEVIYVITNKRIISNNQKIKIVFMNIYKNNSKDILILTII